MFDRAACIATHHFSRVPLEARGRLRLNRCGSSDSGTGSLHATVVTHPSPFESAGAPTEPARPGQALPGTQRSLTAAQIARARMSLRHAPEEQRLVSLPVRRVAYVRTSLRAKMVASGVDLMRTATRSLLREPIRTTSALRAKRSAPCRSWHLTLPLL